MPRFRSTLTAACLLLCPMAQAATAQDLTQQIAAFFQQRLSAQSDDVTVTLRSAASQLPDCDRPALSVPAGIRSWGALTVQTQCGAQKRYLQVTVAATGFYVVTTQAISRGTALEPSSVTLKRGRLDQLPPNTLLDTRRALDAVTLRDLKPDQPVQAFMLRQSWRVRAGQTVQVIASGDGFSASAEGQALNNAAVAQDARVRMASGQVVNGKVKEDGTILINL